MVAVEPPMLDARSALFLDFDGTLAELAERPEAVVVEPDLPDLLAALTERLGGALAIVSGRPIAQIDAYLVPLRLPVAGVHGIERRTAAGRTVYLEPPMLAHAFVALRNFVGSRPGLLLEPKPGALALHYRQAPALEAECRAQMASVCSETPGTAVLHGKMVAELKSAHAGKGHAVDAYLHEAPFLHRHPVVAGDDLTDEDAFAAAQARGGFGIKVGAGPTVARYRMPGTAAVRGWLRMQLAMPAAAAPEPRR